MSDISDADLVAAWKELISLLNQPQINEWKVRAALLEGRLVERGIDPTTWSPEGSVPVEEVATEPLPDVEEVVLDEPSNDSPG